MKTKKIPKAVTKEQRVTYYKRKRGCLKKCIELSMKCGQDVFMVMVDRKSKRLVEFNSTPDFDLKAVMAFMDTYEEKNFQLTKYFNEDLPLLEQNMTPH